MAIILEDYEIYQIASEEQYERDMSRCKTTHGQYQCDRQDGHQGECECTAEPYQYQVLVRKRAPKDEPKKDVGKSD